MRLGYSHSRSQGPRWASVVSLSEDHSSPLSFLAFLALEPSAKLPWAVMDHAILMDAKLAIEDCLGRVKSANIGAGPSTHSGGHQGGGGTSPGEGESVFIEVVTMEEEKFLVMASDAGYATIDPGRGVQVCIPSRFQHSAWHHTHHEGRLGFFKRRMLRPASCARIHQHAHK